MTRMLVAIGLLCAALGVPSEGAQAAKPGQEPPPAGVWDAAPAYRSLFAPSGARVAAYRIYVSRFNIRVVLEQLATDPSLLRPPGSWTPAALLPADAFGQTGRYDRSKLARLYGSTRAVVARGPRGTTGRPAEAWTLISPYPTTDLARLDPGTLLILLDLEWSGGA